MSSRKHARGLAGVFLCLGLLACGGLLGGCAIILPQTEALQQQWPSDLKDRVELESVPFFPQNDYQCGPAALATAMVYDGVAVTPDALISKVYIPDRKGSLQIEMLAAPRSYGLVSWQLAPRFTDLLREVQAGNPVILLQDYGVWPVSVWHYAVVVGFDSASRKVVLRSGEKRRQELPWSVLEYTWKRSDYWAFVALPPQRIAATANEPGWLAAIAAMQRVAPHAAARTAFQTALARWPDSLDGAVGLANAEYAEHDLTAAERVLRSALARHPQSAVLLNNLAQVLLDQNRPAEALQTIDAAVALGGPFTAATQQTRAQIQARMQGGAH